MTSVGTEHFGTEPSHVEPGYIDCVADLLSVFTVLISVFDFRMPVNKVKVLSFT